jgi:hypothetical protein
MSLMWMKPVTGPKAWRGEQLARDSSWIMTLTEGEIAELDRALSTAKRLGLPLEEVTREHFPLGSLARRLEGVLGEIYAGRGFAVLRGLPVGRYRDEDVGLIFWGIGRYLGSPLYQNPRGDLLGHVFHDKTRTYGDPDVRGYISNAYLPYHTDGCDLVGLLSLREALEGGRSSLVSSVTVYNEILANHPEYLELLYHGFYYIRREEVFTGTGVSERPVPVFGARDGVVSCRYLRRQIDAGATRRGVPLSAFERAALDYLDELTERPDLRLDMDLQPGDMQLCNNYTILHSRTQFKDGPEPHQQRHLLRLWLKFPTPWPVGPHFPEHSGYRLATGAKKLAEA